MTEKIGQFEFGEFRLDAVEKRLWRNDELVQIQPRAFDLLNFLLDNGGHLVSKDEILKEVWADSIVEESNLSLNIHALRKMLGENVIETVPRRGYRFTAEIKHLDNISITQNIKSQNISVHQTAIPTVIDGQSVINQQTIILNDEAAKTVAATLQKQVKRQTVWLASLAVLVIGTIGFFSFNSWNKPAENPKPIVTESSRSIAVLPFKNLTKDKQDEFLGIGLTDSLINKLSLIKRISVRPTSSVLSLEESPTPQMLGEKLQVENVLEGTIQRIGNRLKISVQLVQTPTNKVLWASSFEENDSDLLKMQESISTQIANSLLTNLSQDELTLLARAETKNSEAFELYLKGLYFLTKRSDDDLQKSLVFFQQATEKDPNFSLAYIGLGRTYLILGDSGWGLMSPIEATTKARTELEKGLKINPNSAEGVAMLATIELNFDWNIEKANATLKRAIELNPNLSTPHHQLAWLLIAKENYAEAEIEIQKAQKLEPTSPILQTEIGYPAFFAKDYASAEKHFRTALEFDQNAVPARFNLWRVLHQQGKYQESLSELERIKAIINKDIPLLLICKARTQFRLGQTAEAEQNYLSLKDNKEISPIFMAILTAELGKKDETFAYLNKALAERNDYLLNLKHAPEFESLQNDERFANLWEQINAK